MMDQQITTYPGRMSDIDSERLDDFWRYCLKNRYFNVGYPESADFDYHGLERFLKFSMNNCGDWAEPSNYRLNSFEFEKEVIEFFATLYGIDHPDYWGYVSNGSTEGNMLGCYVAREVFPGARLYCSQDVHYSVSKIARMLRMELVEVRSQKNGEMDYDDLSNRISSLGERTPIIFLNIGSTVKGAVDDISVIKQCLGSMGIGPQSCYFHADAALSGMILPFVEEPQPYSFRDGVDSIVVSGHKMIGSPIPCGVVIAKEVHMKRIARKIDYIAAEDRTIMGSRNGITPLIMWSAIRSRSHDDWVDLAFRCLSMAEHAVKRFNESGIGAWRNRNSITVVFPCPSEPIWRKHGLAVSRGVAHLISTGHHLTTDRIDAVIDDVVRDLKR